MKAITLRLLPHDVARAVVHRARKEGTSLNRAVIGLLEEGLGRRAAPRRAKAAHGDLDALAGSWTREEAAEFDRSLRDQRAVDPDAWR